MWILYNVRKDNYKVILRPVPKYWKILQKFKKSLTKVEKFKIIDYSYIIIFKYYH